MLLTKIEILKEKYDAIKREEYDAIKQGKQEGISLPLYCSYKDFDLIVMSIYGIKRFQMSEPPYLTNQKLDSLINSNDRLREETFTKNAMMLAEFFRLDRSKRGNGKAEPPYLTNQQLDRQQQSGNKNIMMLMEFLGLDLSKRKDDIFLQKLISKAEKVYTSDAENIEELFKEKEELFENISSQLRKPKNEKSKKRHNMFKKSIRDISGD